MNIRPAGTKREIFSTSSGKEVYIWTPQTPGNLTSILFFASSRFWRRHSCPAARSSSIETGLRTMANLAVLEPWNEGPQIASRPNVDAEDARTRDRKELSSWKPCRTKSQSRSRARDRKELSSRRTSKSASKPKPASTSYVLANNNHQQALPTGVQFEQKHNLEKTRRVPMTKTQLQFQTSNSSTSFSLRCNARQHKLRKRLSTKHDSRTRNSHARNQQGATTTTTRRSPSQHHRSQRSRRAHSKPVRSINKIKKIRVVNLSCSRFFD